MLLYPTSLAVGFFLLLVIYLNYSVVHLPVGVLT